MMHITSINVCIAVYLEGFLYKPQMNKIIQHMPYREHHVTSVYSSTEYSDHGNI